MAGEKEKEIWVVATQRGYYGDRIRNEGDKFVINDERAFSKNWMKKTSKPKDEASEE